VCQIGSSVCSLSSFTQDIGRGFGYGQRPYIYLSKYILDVLEGISNPKTINDKLKTIV
jgi:hypothetical protein